MSRPLPYLGVQVLQPPRDLGQVHEADIRAEAEAGLGLRAVVAVIREPLESRWRAVGEPLVERAARGSRQRAARDRAVREPPERAVRESR